MTLFLHGLGHFHPENEITNRFLEELEKWGPGDDVAVVGVGAGLTWAGYFLRFEEAA